MKNETVKYIKIIDKADKVILISSDKSGTSITVDNVSIQDAFDMLTDAQELIFKNIQINE